MNLMELEDRVDELSAEYSGIDARLKEVRGKLKKTNLRKLIRTREYIHYVAEATARDVEEKIGKIITLAIKSVVEKPYVFNITFSVRRNVTEADIYLTLPGSTKKYKILETVGGGVSDMISTSLMAAYVYFSESDPIIIMDEPFKFASSGWQKKAGELLQVLGDKLGMQFIIVTHEKELFTCADLLINLDEPEDSDEEKS